MPVADLKDEILRLAQQPVGPEPLTPPAERPMLGEPTDTDALKTEILRLAAGPEPRGAARRALAGFGESVTGAPGKIAEGVGIATGSDALTQFGQSIAPTPDGVLPYVQPGEEGIAANVGRTLGSGATFAPLAALGGPLGIAAVSGSAAAQAIPDAFYGAKANGADDDTAWKAALVSGIGQGALETVLGPERLIGKIAGAMAKADRATGGLGRELLTSAVGEGVEEASQSLWADMVAQDLYKVEPDEDWATRLSKASEQAAYGALGGGVLGSVALAAERYARDEGLPTARPEAPKPAEPERTAPVYDPVERDLTPEETTALDLWKEARGATTANVVERPEAEDAVHLARKTGASVLFVEDDGKSAKEAARYADGNVIILPANADPATSMLAVATHEAVHALPLSQREALIKDLGSELKLEGPGGKKITRPALTAAHRAAYADKADREGQKLTKKELDEEGVAELAAGLAPVMQRLMQRKASAVDLMHDKPALTVRLLRAVTSAFSKSRNAASMEKELEDLSAVTDQLAKGLTGRQRVQAAERIVQAFDKIGVAMKQPVKVKAKPKAETGMVPVGEVRDNLASGVQEKGARAADLNAQVAAENETYRPSPITLGESQRFEGVSDEDLRARRDKAASDQAYETDLALREAGFNDFDRAKYRKARNRAVVAQRALDMARNDAQASEARQEVQDAARRLKRYEDKLTPAQRERLRSTEDPEVYDRVLAAREAKAKGRFGSERALDRAVPSVRYSLADIELLRAEANRTRAAVEALGAEPRQPSSESKTFGSNGRAAADPARVAAYDAEVKAYKSWRSKYLRLKKAEVEASNALFRVEQARHRSSDGETAYGDMTDGNDGNAPRYSLASDAGAQGDDVEAQSASDTRTAQKLSGWWMFETELRGSVGGRETLIDRALRANDADLQEVVSAFQGTRDLLRKKYGDTVRLYRADDVAGRSQTPNKPTLLYADRAQAQNFMREGREMVAADVPIDRILAAVRLDNGYSEFVVDRRGIENRPDRGTFDPANPDVRYSLGREGKKYRYRMQYRPPGFDTLPSGVPFTTEPASKENPFGVAVYDKPLPFKDEEAYQLEPLDPNHPKNIRKTVEARRGRIYEALSESDTVEGQMNGRVYVLGPDTRRPDKMRLTSFDPDGTPTGHMELGEISDAMDEAARMGFEPKRSDVRFSLKSDIESVIADVSEPEGYQHAVASEELPARLVAKYVAQMNPTQRKGVEEMMAEADAVLADRSAREKLVRRALNHEPLNEAEQIALDRIASLKATNAWRQGASMDNAVEARAAFRMARSASGRILGNPALRDALQTPAERAMALALTPSKQVARALKKAKTWQARRAIIEEEARKIERIRYSLAQKGFDPALIPDDYFKDPTFRNVWAESVADAKANGKWDWYIQWRRAAMLSGPITTIRNVTGNTSYVTYDRIARIWADAVIPGTGTSVEDARAYTRDLFAGIAQGWKDARAAYSAFYDASTEGTSLDEHATFRRGPVMVGLEAVGVRAQAAQDIFFRSVVGAAETRLRARQKARAEGGTAEDYMSDPDVLAMSKEDMERALFLDRDALTRSITGARDWLDEKARFPVGTTIVPFAATPTKIVQRGGETLLGPLGGYMRDREKWGGALLGAGAWAAMIWAASMFDDDDGLPLITGSRARGGQGDFQDRTAPAYSIRIGDEYYSYQTIEPLSTALAAIADAVQSEDPMKSVSSFAAAAKDKSFFRSIETVYDAIVGAANGERGSDRAKQVARDLLWTPMIPNIVRSPVRAADETRRKELGNPLEAEDFLNAAVPTGDFGPPLRYDLWGRPAEKAGGSWVSRVLAPAMGTKDVEDVEKIDLLLTDYNRKSDEDKFFSAPAVFVTRNGERRDWTEDEYSELTRDAGAQALAILRPWAATKTELTERDLKHIGDVLSKTRARKVEELLRR